MKTVAIIGAGPGGLMAAEKLAAAGFKVDVYDQRPSPARKFLMAGRGGLNITHSEPIDTFITRYGEAADFLRPALHYFTPQDLRDWVAGLGEDTFIGTSGRVFPKSFKASPLLRAWLHRLQNLGVTIHYNFIWTGQDMGTDITILALGGASWPRLGSDGHWVDVLKAKGICISPLRPANCGFKVNWSPVFSEKFAGHPVKPVVIRHGAEAVQAEMMITQGGVEGGGIYALSKSLRQDIERQGAATITLNFKPDKSLAEIELLLKRPRGRESFSNYIRKTLGLSPVVIGLLQEDREISKLSPAHVASRIQSYSITLINTAPIDRAISSAGGISRDEVNESFMLKKIPHTYVIGEMVDWEAPTGGYLLQGTFSMACWLVNCLTKEE